MAELVEAVARAALEELKAQARLDLDYFEQRGTWLRFDGTVDSESLARAMLKALEDDYEVIERSERQEHER